MATPKHLDGLVGVLTAVEEATQDTGYEWMLRTDRVTGGFFASIFREAGEKYPHHDPTPTGALSRSLMEFNLRRRT